MLLSGFVRQEFFLCYIKYKRTNFINQNVIRAFPI